MFNGRNIMPNSLEDLTKVVNFLLRKYVFFISD